VPALLNVATQVVPKERFSGSEFAWLSEDAYATFGKDNRTLSRYDLIRGDRTQLIAPLGSRAWGSHLRASPDGKWLDWIKFSVGPRYGDVMHVQHAFTHVSDGRTFPWKTSFQGTWESDSRHVLSVEPGSTANGGARLVIFDPFANRIRQTLPLAGDVSSTLENCIEVEPGYLLEISQVSPSNPASLTKERIGIREYRVDETLRLTREWSIAPPHGTAVGNIMRVKLSPHGEQIAWLVDSVQIDPGRAALQRLLPFLKAPPQVQQQLWISCLDGKGMRLVGQTLLKTRSGNEVRITDLRWLPNGKRLSFSYEDALWTVPTH